MLNATDTPGINLAAYSYWALSDVFTEQGLPQHNISFSGNWGLVNVFGGENTHNSLVQGCFSNFEQTCKSAVWGRDAVRKPSFRAFQLLRDAGSTRATLT